MRNFQGSGTDTVVTTLGVTSTQSTRTFFAARIAPPDVSWFDGNYSGTLVIIDAKSGPDRLGLKFTVAGGIVTLTAPFGGSGSLGAVGRFQVRFDSLACGLNGALEAKTATGAAVGGGVMPVCQDGGHGTGWGMWDATRTSRP